MRPEEAILRLEYVSASRLASLTQDESRSVLGGMCFSLPAKVLVENNVSPDTGKAVDDHLEVALKNTGSRPLDNVAIYYAIRDPVRVSSPCRTA